MGIREEIVKRHFQMLVFRREMLRVIFNRMTSRLRLSKLESVRFSKISDEPFSSRFPCPSGSLKPSWMGTSPRFSATFLSLETLDTDQYTPQRIPTRSTGCD